MYWFGFDWFDTIVLRFVWCVFDLLVRCVSVCLVVCFGLFLAGFWVGFLFASWGLVGFDLFPVFVC